MKRLDISAFWREARSENTLCRSLTDERQSQTLKGARPEGFSW